MVIIVQLPKIKEINSHVLQISLRKRIGGKYIFPSRVLDCEKN